MRRTEMKSPITIGVTGYRDLREAAANESAREESVEWGDRYSCCRENSPGFDL